MNPTTHGVWEMVTQWVIYERKEQRFMKVVRNPQYIPCPSTDSTWVLLGPRGNLKTTVGMRFVLCNCVCLREIMGVPPSAPLSLFNTKIKSNGILK